jgi:diacylglycerol kinase family enzyme
LIDPVGRRVAFIINVQAGQAGAQSWLEENRPAVETIANGGPVLQVKDGTEIAGAVRQALASQCDAIVAGGGDGTLNAVACRLIGTKTAFGILPLGTLNHFARDLGIPRDPGEALAAIAAGHHAAIDAGEVNGHYFLNNSSLGLYPDIVRDRERQQHRLGRGKWVAFAWAVWGALRRFPFLTVRLSVDGKAAVHRTPFVFVGNNAYQMQGFQIGTRAGLQDGVLSIYVAHKPTRLGLALLGLRALFGRLRQTREFHAFLASELRVETRQGRLRVATDGEVRTLEPPFLYRIHAGALRVIVPRPEGGTSA